MIFAGILLFNLWFNGARLVLGADALDMSIFGVLLMLSILTFGSGVHYSATFYQRYRFETPPQPVPYLSAETPWPEQSVSPLVQQEVKRILSKRRPKTALRGSYQSDLTLKIAKNKRSRKTRTTKSSQT